VPFFLLLLLLASPPVFAAGSQNLWPNPPTGNRANSEWRTSTYGGGALFRRTLIKAFMNAGEVLLLGSSAVGQGTSDILVYNPGLVTGPVGAETVPLPGSASFSCNIQRTAIGAPAAQGIIASRAEELAGPDTIPASVAGAYVPCHYTAPVKGIYDIAFLGPNGFVDNADGAVVGDVNLASANDFNGTQGSSVAAWDATVRTTLAAPVSTLPGRVFSYYLALFTAGNGRPVYPSIYPLTTDGYRYRIDLRGMDPNGWLVYGNQVGFYDSDGVTPLYHDAVAANSGSPAQLTTIQGGVSIARPSFPLFFEPPAAAAIVALGIPTTTVAPTMTALTFVGNLGGNTSLVNTGGTFTYVGNVPGLYNIVISRDGVNFDPTSPTNRSLRGVRGAGANTVTWDGRDNGGAAFPVGSYQVRASLHGGEYHFPMLDVENDTQGGPTLTLLNPPGGVCPALTGGCNSSFYDDRAYATLNGTVVDAGNTVGSVLCGLLPPTPPNSDPVNGFDSTTVQRAFGAASGGNTNVPCTGNFGDTKGLDSWTYFPSNQAIAPLNLVAAAADIGVTKSVSNPTPATGTNVTFTVTVTNHGPNDATSVQVTDPIPSGLTLVSATPAQGTYTAGTGLWNIGPLANGASTTMLIVATVTGTSPVTNTATRTASAPVDPNSANDTASATVTGSDTPGLPADGVPPVAGLWPALPALLLLVVGGLAVRRRRFPLLSGPPALQGSQSRQEHPDDESG
jgi:uncharacterized repeat protein (TIGR01451 family)